MLVNRMRAIRGTGVPRDVAASHPECETSDSERAVIAARSGEGEECWTFSHTELQTSGVPPPSLLTLSYKAPTVDAACADVLPTPALRPRVTRTAEGYLVQFAETPECGQTPGFQVTTNQRGEISSLVLVQE